MGHKARISLVGPDGRCIEHALAQAFLVIERFLHMTDRDLPCSDLTRLCSSDAGSLVPVPNRLWQLLRLANDVACRTNGVFDVAAAGSAGSARWTDIDLSKPGHVRLRRRMFLSLGGLKRGFAVDLAIQALKELGVGSGLADIGGCIRAFGPRAWRIDFRPGGGLNAETDRPVIPLQLQGGAVAGIGSMFGAARLHDTVTDTVGSTAHWADMNMLVRAESCAMADALSKVAALSPAASKNHLAPFGADAIVLTSRGAAQLNYVS